jgi:CheY-like chemotaxis protein
MVPPTQVSKLVLVVEEQPATRQALASVFQSEGYQVVTAATGREALQLLRRSSPQGLIPGVVLLSVRGPNLAARDDASSFLEEQQHDTALSTIPVILMTDAGVELPSPPAQAAAARLQKPVPLNTLVRLVQNCTQPN